MNKSEERYILTLTPEQEIIVEQALELFARLHIGQFKTVTEMLLDFRRGMEDYCLRRDMANDLLNLAAITIFGRDTYGQLEIKERSKEHECAWLVYTALRHARSWHDHPKGGYTVNFDKPCSTGEPMPRCKIEKGENI